MKLWSDFGFEFQRQMLDKLEEFLLKKTDNDVRLAIATGITELEIWSNTPCKKIDNFEGFSDPDIGGEE